MKMSVEDSGGDILRILNCIESKDQASDLTLESVAEFGDVDLALESTPPQSVDLREPWWEINDQGSTGSCVGWAAADSVLRWNFVKAKKIKESERLSVRYLWMACKEMDRFTNHPTTFIEGSGTSIKTALDIAKRFGVVKEDELPFDAGLLFLGDEKAFYSKAAKLMINRYVNLGRNQNAWRQFLATKGPILTRLKVDHTWMTVYKKIGDGKLDTYKPDPKRGGHAVALVGYNADSFIVRNSWGDKQADKGYAYASLGYAKDAFTEAYGVLM